MQTRPYFGMVLTERKDRWAAAKRFAAFWHQDFSGINDAANRIHEAETRLGKSIPASVAEWHTLAGDQLSGWCDRAKTMTLAELEFTSEGLVVRTEAVFRGLRTVTWAIRSENLDQEDPPVWSIWGGHVESKISFDSYSHFALGCMLFDTVNSTLLNGVAPRNEVPFPADGVRVPFFPESFGIIKTQLHEGPDWIALVSGNDWYLRRCDPDSKQHEFVKHEVRDAPQD